MCRTSFWRPTDRLVIQMACMDVEQEGWQIQSPGFYISLPFFSLFKLLLILVNISMYFRIRMYEHEGQWEKAVITYDIGLQQHTAEQEVDLLKVRVYWI